VLTRRIRQRLRSGPAGEHHHQSSSVAGYASLHAGQLHSYQLRVRGDRNRMGIGFAWLALQMAIESISRQTSTAAELKCGHATVKKLRYQLLNLCPSPSLLCRLWLCEAQAASSARSAPPEQMGLVSRLPSTYTSRLSRAKPSIFTNLLALWNPQCPVHAQTVNFAGCIAPRRCRRPTPRHGFSGNHGVHAGETQRSFRVINGPVAPAKRDRGNHPTDQI